MPLLITHLAAVHRLADRHRASLPPGWAEALRSDLPYARFGAALLLLPTLGRQAQARTYARRMHALAPSRLGLKLAELTSRGALVGEGPGRALVAGYFTHLCLDAALVPLERVGRRGLARTHARVLLEAVFPSGRADSARGRERLWHVTKSRRFPVRGVGRGLYELLRLASEDTLHEAPTKVELDRWVRRLALRSLLPTPLTVSARGLEPGQRAAVMREVDGALAAACLVLERVHALTQKTRWSPRAYRDFVAAFPGVGGASCAA